MIVRCIGSGGVGAVYEAEQQSLGRQVAIKLLHPEQLRRARGKERFEREARTAASISHPHVVAVYDFDTHQGVPYLVMELLRGQTVEELLATSGRLPLRRGLLLLLGASRGLEALHASGLVHRDLKPANLFVSRADGAEHCKILDFGISKQREDQNLTMSSELVGTPAYMAPERIERPAQADHRADIYALAVTAYEMFTGDNLHDEGTPHEILLRVMAGTLPPLSAFTAVMPETLARLLYRCLSKRPEDRPQTAAELSTALERVLQDLSAASAAPDEKLTPPSPQVVAEPAKRGKGKRALYFALLGGSLVVALAAFLIVKHGLQPQAWLATASGNAATSAALPAGAPTATASAGAASKVGAAAAPDGAPSERATAATPTALTPTAAAHPAAAAALAAQRASGSGSLAANAVDRRKADVERSSAFQPRPAEARGSGNSAAEPPTASASAARSPADAPRFIARSEPPQFVPRASDDPADPRSTSTKERQPLAPGHLFRPRPSKENQAP